MRRLFAPLTSRRQCSLLRAAAWRVESSRGYASASIDWASVEARRTDRASPNLNPTPATKLTEQEKKVMIGAVADHCSFEAMPLPELAARLPDDVRELVDRSAGLLRVVRGNPDRFTLSRDGSGALRVRLVDMDDAMHITPAPSLASSLHAGDGEVIVTANTASTSASGSNPTDPKDLLRKCPVALAGEASKVFQMLQPILPSSFFVPLPTVFDNLPAHIQRAAEEQFGAGPAGLFSALQGLSASEVDVRILGEDLSDIFVRAVAENLPCFLEAEEGDSWFAEYDVTQLAAPLYEAMLGHGPVPADQLSHALAPELYNALPLKGASAILVFDRLQYAFDVDFSTYTVVAKPAMEPGMTGLSMRTTPSPRALRFILTNLVQPASLRTVESELPEEIYETVSAHFGDLEQFVAMHPLYLFVKDDVLWSTELHAKYDTRSGTAKGPATASAVWRREIAEYMHSCLPEDRGLQWRQLRFGLPHEYAREVGKKPKTFLQQYPDLFACYELLQQQAFIVQRPKLPAPRNAIPPVTSEYELLRVVAMHTVDPQTLEGLSHHLPGDAKRLLATHGGLRRWLEWYSEWFYADGDYYRYVGHLPQARELLGGIGGSASQLPR
jgi:hypothetical protein